VAIAIAYAEEAIDDKIHFGKWFRLAARRFIADLKRAQRKRAAFHFSPAWANRGCAFVELLPHVEGTWKTATIELHPVHIFFAVNLFGFRKPDGRRRFTMALLSTARKNAKTTIGAAIMLACECLENENGAQLLSAATTGQQARLAFNTARRMAQQADGLQEEFDIEAQANSIVRYETGAYFKPINSKASTQDGLNPSHVLLDEIHAHKTRDLVDVLASAAGGRANPLWMYTTTEGYESPGPWSELRSFAQNVLQGVVDADHFLAIYCAVDDDDSDFDEAAWVKANPLMSVNPLILEKMRELAIGAKNMPGSLAEFRIKRLNRRAAAAHSWANLTRWRRCDGPVDLEKMAGHPCWAGFDGASTTDMAAWRLLWKIEDIFYTWGRFWVPADAVASRTERKSVNYAGWIQQGLVTQCEGATNDYGIIKRDVLLDIRRFNPTIIAYDPWNATQFINDLIAEGVDAATPDEPRGLMQFIQGPRSFTPAMKLCEAEYLNGRLRHGGNPVLTWHIANVVPSFDSNMNIKPNKQRSPDKIDGAVALFMAFGCAALQQPDDSDPFAAMVTA
jgi:phage terminase large subunit-like protein